MLAGSQGAPPVMSWKHCPLSVPGAVISLPRRRCSTVRQRPNCVSGLVFTAWRIRRRVPLSQTQPFSVISRPTSILRPFAAHRRARLMKSSPPMYYSTCARMQQSQDGTLAYWVAEEGNACTDSLTTAEEFAAPMENSTQRPLCYRLAAWSTPYYYDDYYVLLLLQVLYFAGEQSRLLGSAMRAYWVRNRRRYDLCLGLALEMAAILTAKASLRCNVKKFSTPCINEDCCLGAALHTSTTSFLFGVVQLEMVHFSTLSLVEIASRYTLSWVDLFPCSRKELLEAEYRLAHETLELPAGSVEDFQESAKKAQCAGRTNKGWAHHLRDIKAYAWINEYDALPTAFHRRNRRKVDCANDRPAIHAGQVECSNGVVCGVSRLKTDISPTVVLVPQDSAQLICGVSQLGLLLIPIPSGFVSSFVAGRLSMDG
ncbi:uncharacterized protein TRIVIDRAFT_67562 [Trichoderma virens Gv29-8]|uniref:Uncharacterized protein n=1 Tax=Hypocrea virens (strain Gv29-8 / FGSC 10586) TaxID=413071 RepID=G9MPW6_HYPVG|nr:uncharacterized protein TRIVIDRAFT_67562 [Trichoderma virens Gv29-8]EHK23916.1 hypothetical protein TRIVIDRAFT_67562 [Trichoderma virens Gv29-8]